MASVTTVAGSSHYQGLTLKARLARGKLQPLFSAHAQAHDASWCLELWGRPAIATLLGVATRFTELVGCDLPVQLAAMGGVGTVELAAAVAAAGGFGMVPAMAEGVPEGCGLNYLMPFVPPVDEIRESARRARVVEFFYGNPRVDLVAAVHKGGALTGWQVGSANEAKAAEEAGCDYVVAQGIEAGGHVRGELGLDLLLGRFVQLSGSRFWQPVA